MFPGCSRVGWLLALPRVAAGNSISLSGKGKNKERRKFAGVRAGVASTKRETFWKSESNAPVGET